MTTTALQQLLREQRAPLFADWRNRVAALEAQEHRASGFPDDTTHVLDPLLLGLFNDILSILEHSAQTPPALTADDAVGTALRQIVSHQAQRGSNANAVIGVILTLKHALSARLLATTPPAEITEFLWIEQVFEQLTQLSFSAFIAARERQITQQSLSLLELSTPVLRLWHRVLLLPLVGVIDTVRARQITENLLEAIARYEARVTILDLTGVPVLDTSVAQHLMKTIDAARLLGTRVVMTGISPEGAQTLTKLGIRFADVISRATLRAGIAEALLLIGQRIAPLEDAPR